MEHFASPGRRFAYVCKHKDHKVPPRVFLKPREQAPKCEQHGTTMQRQSNNSYFGDPVL